MLSKKNGNIYLKQLHETKYFFNIKYLIKKIFLVSYLLFFKERILFFRLFEIKVIVYSKITDVLHSVFIIIYNVMYFLIHF